MKLPAPPIIDEPGHMASSSPAILPPRRVPEATLPAAEPTLLKTDELAPVDPTVVPDWGDTPVGLAVATLDGRLVRVNPALSELLALGSHELEGQRWASLCHPGDPERELVLEPRVLAGERPWGERSQRLLRRDGRVLHITLRLRPLRGADGRIQAILCAALDVTDQVEARDRLVHAALHDALTRLPNRRSFIEAVGRHLALDGQPGAAVLFVDFDLFKSVNDCVGHHLGDRVLVMFANRVARCAGVHRTVARYGGDEFTVLFTGPDALQAARTAAAALHEQMRAPLLVDGRELYCTASVGLATPNPEDPSAESLMRDADIALGRAKERGRACTVEFDGSMRAEVLERHALRTDLHTAAARGELTLHYQPIVDLRSRQVVGFESLMRWQHPERGPLGPDKFLPIAEDYGLSPELGRWTVRAAIAELAATPQLDQVYVSVNLSMRQLADPQLLATFEAALAETAVPPRRLRVEVTEQVMAEDVALVEQVLQTLRRRGIGVYMDDFGTGVSSYARLHRLPIDALKIDQAFVRGMIQGEDALSLVRSILGLALSLRLPAIAEGVETEEQRDVLLGLGCELAQGWLFGRARSTLQGD